MEKDGLKIFSKSLMFINPNEINEKRLKVLITAQFSPVLVIYKLGCAGVKLQVWLEFLKVLYDLIKFDKWVTMLEIVGDHSLGCNPWESGWPYFG